MTDALPPSSPVRGWIFWLTVPHKIVNALFFGAFLLAVGRMYFFDGGTLEQVGMFVIPTALAFGATSDPATPLAWRRVGSAFLALIGFGDAFAWGGVKLTTPHQPTNLSDHDLALLAWYVVIYLVFLFGVVPPVLFLRSLKLNREGLATALSPPTCYFGLVSWTVVMILLALAGVVAVAS
jgi:hypothetical protein